MPTNELTKQQPTALTTEEIEVLEQANIIPAGTPVPIIKTFAKFCSEKNLSPVQRQIYLIPRKDRKTNKTRYTFQTAIDGFRTIAERTGKYAGNDDYRFDEGLTEYDMIKQNRKQPTTATAVVHKVVDGLMCSFSATARWEEYYPGDAMGFMWKKMPYLMLGKCAEALALRKAFPEALGGIYTNDEMMQADVPEKPKEKPKGKSKNNPAPKEKEKLEWDMTDPILKQINESNSTDNLNKVYTGLDEKDKAKYLPFLSERKQEIKKETADQALNGVVD